MDFNNNSCGRKKAKKPGTGNPSADCAQECHDAANNGELQTLNPPNAGNGPYQP